MQNSNHIDSGGCAENAPIYIQGTRDNPQPKSEISTVDRANSADGQRNLSTLLAVRRFCFFCLFIALIFTLRGYTQKKELAQKLQEYKKAKDAAGRTLYSQNK